MANAQVLAHTALEAHKSCPPPTGLQFSPLPPSFVCMNESFPAA